MHRDWCPSASAVSGAPGEPDDSEEVTHETKSMFSFAFSPDLIHLFQAASVKNVWPPSACSQVSAVFFYARTTKFVRAQICVGDIRVSRLQVKGRQHYLRQNIGPAIAGSA